MRVLGEGRETTRGCIQPGIRRAGPKRRRSWQYRSLYFLASLVRPNWRLVFAPRAARHAKAIMRVNACQATGLAECSLHGFQIILILLVVLASLHITL